jgi:hypothetical protein
MDPALIALCMEVLEGDVDGERFASLMIETGISVESFEFDVANRLLEQNEAINSLQRKFGNTIH